MQIDPVLSLALNIHSSKGICCLLLGSGSSRAAQIPTGWEVVLDLICRIAKLESSDCEPDPAAWFKLRYGEAPDYSKLLDMLASTPEQRHQILKPYFEPTEEERERGIKCPTAAHHAIARLVSGGYLRVILTTNFDRLIETAIVAQGVTPVVLSTTDSLTGALPLIHQRCVVVKLHGDYLDTRIRNTPSELDKYDRSTDRLLNQVLDDFGLMVVGWSGEWDHALRRAIERCKTRRFGFWWAAINDPAPIASKLIQARGGSVLKISGADDFLEGLANKVAVLDDVYLDHPVNTAAAVALVKRYIADPNQRVRLHDLLIKEADRAFDAADVVHAQMRLNSNGPYGKVVQRYLAATSTLRQVMAAAAFWGDDTIVPVLTKCVMKLGQDRLVSRGGGPVLNMAFRLYPVMTALYATGLAFVAADKYAALAQFVTQSQFHDFNGVKQVLREYTYNLREIKVVTEGLDGYKNNHVPFSELMFSTLSPELADIFAEPVEYDRKFDEFELLSAILFGDLAYRKLPEKLEEVYLTPGRYVWKHFNFKIRSELFWFQEQGDEVAWSKRQKPFTALIESGFFAGDWNRLVTFRHAAAIMAAQWSFRH